MIYNIGTDIVKIKRMERFCERGFMSRCFTEGEIAHCRESRSMYETAAGIFAAKEAFSKASGKGIFDVLKDAEVCYDDGRPFFNLKNGLGGGLRFSLSISHDGDYAVAFVVAEAE